jgi:hypothetical protein
MSAHHVSENTEREGCESVIVNHVERIETACSYKFHQQSLNATESYGTHYARKSFRHVSHSINGRKEMKWNKKECSFS